MNYIISLFVAVLSAITAIFSYIFGREQFKNKVAQQEAEQCQKVSKEYEESDIKSANYHDDGQPGLIKRLHDEADKTD